LAVLVGVLALTLHSQMTYWHAVLLMVAIAAAGSITILPLKIIAQNAAPSIERATVVAINTFASLLGGSIGLPFAGVFILSYLFHQLVNQYI
jgi:hypothetical protein